MAEQAAGVAESAPALEVESEPESWRSDDPNRDEAVVIQTGSLAEVILTTPLVASAAQRGPVDVVVRGAVADVLESNPAIRRVFRHERSAEDLTDLTALWRTLRAVRGRRTAGESERRSGRERRARRIAYVADSSMRSALLALFADVDERVGFATAPGRALYTRRVPFLEDQHHAGRLLALAAADGDPRPAPEVLRPHLFPSAADVAAVDALLEAAASRAARASRHRRQPGRHDVCSRGERRRGRRTRDRCDGQALRARLGGAHSSRCGPRRQRFDAGAPRVGDGNADADHLRSDRPRVRLSPTRPAQSRARTPCAALPTLRPAGTEPVPAWSLAVYARDFGG
jgi:hypothetical protein